MFLLKGYGCGLCLLEGQRQSAKNIIHCKNKHKKSKYIKYEKASATI